MENQPESPTLPASVQEVQGVFPSDAALQDAIGRLTRAGFDRAALSLPAPNPTADEATPTQGADDPTTEDDIRQTRTMQTSMAATAAAFIGAGVTVATGGVAPPLSPVPQQPASALPPAARSQPPTSPPTTPTRKSVTKPPPPENSCSPPPHTIRTL